MTSTISRPEAAPGGQRRKPAQRRFLEDKLQIPRSHFPVLRRPRLASLLDRATRHRVTLVSAPAGAGKTVACAAWAAAAPQQGRVVWLTLDANDQGSWFWAYVCAGLTRLETAPPDVLRSLEQVSAEGFPMRLVETAQSFTAPVILVLDNAHEVADRAVLAGLDLLIRHAPAGLRLVLLARQPPALQLARLRVAGELADIGGPDLACTADEASAYLAMMGIAVDAAARDELLRRTAGWMAGMRLAAMRALSGQRPGATITDLAADEPMVTDYMWDEVLGRQPPETRLFLLRTSIAEDLSGGLADALTAQSGGARTLDRLNRENSFVDALDRERGEYRYHPLLRDVLTAALHREIPHEVPVLRHRAAQWYAAHGRPVDAVRCVAEGNDWDYAAQILAEAGAGAAMLDQAAGMEAVLALFPAERSSGDPAVAGSWAAARLCEGDLEGAACCLDSAQLAVERSAPAMRRIMEPTLAALRLTHAGCLTDPDPGLLADGWSLAKQCQPAASTQAEHRGVGLLWFALGTAALRRWETQAARRALREADRELGAGGLPAGQARARAWRALAEACYGDLTAAQRSADEVRGCASPGAAASLAGLALAQISLCRDDLAAAHRLLDDVDNDSIHPLPGEPPVSAVAGMIRAQVMLAEGDPAAAAAVASRLGESWGPAYPALSEVIALLAGEAALRAGNTGRVRDILLHAEEDERAGRVSVWLLRAGLEIADGDFPAALDTVQPCLDCPGGEAADRATRQQRLAALLLAAVAHRRLGAAKEATRLVEQALALAEPDGAVRVVLDVGSGVRSAITVLIPPASRHAGFAGRVLERFEAQPARPAGQAEQASVPLTASERAVLCFLPSHMTNEEISQALFLSVNTVKTHLRSAYRKLGVGSRREAIARGRRIGLL
jgi:LuxR family maltose regulon positive regulatory protein